jgi:putative endonuclease
MKEPCVYILASGRHGTIDVGVTSNLMQPLAQHRGGAFGGFTAEHNVKRLVYFEMHGGMTEAIAREKRLKNWHRSWKVRLIEEHNPFWEDRAIDLGFPPLEPR